MLLKTILVIISFLSLADFEAIAQKHSANKVRIIKKTVYNAPNPQDDIIQKNYYDKQRNLVREVYYLNSRESTEKKYEYENKLLLKSEVLKDSKIINSVRYKYSNGLLENELDSSAKNYKTEKKYFYDARNNLMRIEKNEYIGQTPNNNNIQYFFYDNRNRNIKSVTLNSDKDTISKSYFEYYREKKIKHYLAIDKNKRVQEEYKCDYDKKGNLIQKTFLKHSKPFVTEEYHYDNNNKILSHEKKNATNESIYKENFVYNDKGNLTKLTQEDIKLNNVVIKEFINGQLAEETTLKNNQPQQKISYSYQ